MAAWVGECRGQQVTVNLLPEAAIPLCSLSFMVNSPTSPSTVTPPISLADRVNTQRLCAYRPEQKLRPRPLEFVVK